MGDLLLLALIVLGATAMWPLNRWAMRRGARTERLGMVISLVALLTSIGVAVFWKKPLFVREAAICGAVAGVAYAVGFILIIFYCLKIGPAGPTVTANNMGLLWPMTVDVFFFSGISQLTPMIVCGAVVSLLSLTLMGWAMTEHGADAAMTARWARWIIVGWMFSGVSMSSQFISGRLVPDAPFAFVNAMMLTALVVLSGITIAQKSGLPTRDEWLAGLSTGGIVTFLLAATVILLTRAPSAVVYPVTVAGPAVLVLLMGHLLLGERLSGFGWAASILGVGGIILLTLR